VQKKKKNFYWRVGDVREAASLKPLRHILGVVKKEYEEWAKLLH
jgi:hypothetical protein